MRKTRKGKRRSFIDTYQFPDGTPARAATAEDWARSAKAHERQANKLWRLSERCLRMAEKTRKAAFKGKAY
ncbi:MAG: hypothetical protein J0I19_09455 [Alphaproteobacteria bacterium]|nr:hypothetical protein [Alphaproteobacteria bacterium]